MNPVLAMAGASVASVLVAGALVSTLMASVVFVPKVRTNRSAEELVYPQYPATPR